jgi:hypothetical protein
MYELWYYRIFSGILFSPIGAVEDTAIPEDATLPEYFRFDGATHVIIHENSQAGTNQKEEEVSLV